MSKIDTLRVQDYLEHIVDAIDRIHRYVDDMVEATFLQDEKTQDAVVRNFEVIGEASRNIERHHAAFAAANPHVPWEVMYTMRNRVAHGYFKVDYEIVWQTILADLPPLREQINALIPPRK
jgi:uncharacterized protein with HEPN domain